MLYVKYEIYINALIKNFHCSIILLLLSMLQCCFRLSSTDTFIGTLSDTGHHLEQLVRGIKKPPCDLQCQQRNWDCLADKSQSFAAGYDLLPGQKAQCLVSQVLAQMPGKGTDTSIPIDVSLIKTKLDAMPFIQPRVHLVLTHFKRTKNIKQTGPATMHYLFCKIFGTYQEMNFCFISRFSRCICATPISILD